ncbi:hypothetical protein P3G55_08960 [Leptospira sp. 96542]|nr:hypothetical protein [Leptospira sp. 96542]
MEFSSLLRLFLCLPLVLIFQTLSGEPRLPKEPNAPVLNFEEKKEEKPANEKKEFVVLNLTLCDGRTVRGESPSSIETISFEHNKDGILYKKKLNLGELGSIKIDSWELKQKREEKKGMSFEVVPKKIRIRTKAGETFYKDTGLADLKLLNFEIKNNNGVAILYSYWIDLKYPDGSWYSGLPAVKNNALTREDCLKDVVRMVEWE